MIETANGTGDGMTLKVGNIEAMLRGRDVVLFGSVLVMAAMLVYIGHVGGAQRAQEHREILLAIQEHNAHRDSEFARTAQQQEAMLWLLSLPERERPRLPVPAVIREKLAAPAPYP